MNITLKAPVIDAAFEVVDTGPRLFSLYSLESVGIVMVHVIFALSPFLLAMTLMVRAGWLPS